MCGYMYRAVPGVWESWLLSAGVRGPRLEGGKVGCAAEPKRLRMGASKSRKWALKEIRTLPSCTVPCKSQR
jgi:hypothetical protein